MSNPYPAVIIDANGSVREGILVDFTDPDNQPGGGGQSGDGTPTGNVTPDSIGQLYVDATNGGLYIATGVTDTDWVIVGGVRAALDDTTQGFGLVVD